MSRHAIPRTLFVTDTVPPFIGGSVTLMYNLFLGLDTSNSMLVTQSADGFSVSRSGGLDASISLEMKRREIPGLPQWCASGSRWGVPYLSQMAQTPRIAAAAAKAAREIDAQVIMTCWPNEAYTTAGWMTARKLKLPLVVYLHDLWTETRRDPLGHFFANRLEPKILRPPTRTLVISPPTVDYLRKRSGVESQVLEHSVNSQLWPLDNPTVREPKKPTRILMLGAVNKFNQDSVVRFSEAIAAMPDVGLTILTGQKRPQLEALGVNCERIETKFAPRDQLQQTIREADVLYTALGFNTPVQQEVEVVIPTRLMDYLPTGIPIVVHGPANAWMIEEARNRGWAHVLDTLETAQIHASMDAFLARGDHSAEVNGAWAEARRRDYQAMSGVLAGYLNEAASAGREEW